MSSEKSLVQSIEAFDHRIIMWVAKHRLSWLTPLVRVLTFTGRGRVFFSLVGIFYFAKRYPVPFFSAHTDFLPFLIPSFCAFIINLCIKWMVRRRRPYEILDIEHHRLDFERTASFPSTHASASMALFFTLWQNHHAGAPYFGIWAALICYTRIYLGVHFFTDVLGGAILGYLYTFIPRLFL